MRLIRRLSIAKFSAVRATLWGGVSALVIGCAPNVAVESGNAAIDRLNGGSRMDVTQPREVRNAESTAASSVQGLVSDRPDDSDVLTQSIEPSEGSQVPSTTTAMPALASSGSPLSIVIAVCPSPYRAALEPWVQRRQREGLEVIVIPSQSTAKALKQSIVEHASDRCRYILLVGDSTFTPNEEPLDASFSIPTVYRNADVTATYQQSPHLPGDYAYGDFDDDGIAEAAVGRLPVNSAAEVATLVKRIVSYEESTDFSHWRSRVDLVAGIGGFGPMIDGAIEMVAGGIITGSLPGFVRTRITHASPTSDFHPGVDRFTSTVLENYQDGARFWVYAGHGWVNELDRVPPTQFGRPVLSTSDLSELKCEHTASPIALMLACYTGAFDANEDCLAERMLLADQGPIAVLAGSRVTMPYGNAAAAVGLIHAVYHRKVDRLGDAWREALSEMATSTQVDPELRSRRMMIDGIASLLGGGSRMDDERREHMQLYNWFGDPTLRLQGGDEVQVKPLEEIVADKPFVIEGVSPIAGRLTVEVHRRLGSPLAVTAVGGEDREDIEVKYVAANETVLCRCEQEVEVGPWACTIAIPKESSTTSKATTPVIARVSVVSESGFAIGSQTGWLRPQSSAAVKQTKAAVKPAVSAKTE